MSDYSFNDYNEQTDFTRKGIHTTSAYTLLGLIGELGEVVKEFNLPDEDSVKLNQVESEFVDLLFDFVYLATKIEAFKKQIRKDEIVLLPDVKFTDKLTEEAGGVYWYLNSLVGLNGLKMADVAQANQEMLDRRFKANPDWMKGGVKTH